MSAGAILKTLRGNRTIREVAGAVGISPSALAMYENGHRTPRDEVKVKLSDFYMTPVQDIFFRENEHI